MLTRPLTLTESDDRGRGLAAVTPPPALPLADEGDDDEDTQTGVFSPAPPPWSSASSSSSSPSSAPSLTPPLPLPSSTAPPLPPSLTPPLPLPSSTAPPLPPSLTPFISPPLFLHPPLPPSVSTPPPLLHLSPPSSLSPHPPPVFCTKYYSPDISPPSLLPPSVSFPPSNVPPPPPLPVLTSSSPPTVSPPPPLPVLSPPLPPAPPPPLPVLSPPLPPAPPPPLPVLSPPLPPAPPPPLPVLSPPLPPAPPPPLPVLSPPLPPAPPPPSCPCSSLLPRLLSAHRMEVRRLLRGALSSLGRRLASLERRSLRRRRRGKRRSRGRSRQRGVEEEEEEGGGSFSPAPSCSPAHRPAVTTSSSSSSSSDSEDPPTPRLSCSGSQSEERRRSREEEGGGKRRRKNHRRRGRSLFTEHRGGEEEEEQEEEQEAGRFVGRMAVSFRGGGAEQEAPLTLHRFTHRKHRRRAGQSEKAISVARLNGYRQSSSSQHAFHLLQSVNSQSEALTVSSGQWRFSDSAPSLSSNHAAFQLWHLSSSSSLNPAPMLRLSAVAVETVSDSVRGGACWSPLRLLKDWTAPPSLGSDHCYVRTPTASPTFSTRRQQKQRSNHSSRGLRPTRRRPLPLPPCSANGLSAPLAVGQSAAGSEFLSTNGERCKRVSQIRIRRASPRETLLTPMGLPKVKRLKKKEFSLEEIYTNKNYKSPSTNRSLETIFEEPREKDGAPLLIGQQRRRRLLLFPDFTQPRKRKRPQGAGLPVAMVPRKRAAARRHCHGDDLDDDSDLDVMLVERLSALEDFLSRQGLDCD